MRNIKYIIEDSDTSNSPEQKLVLETLLDNLEESLDLVQSNIPLFTTFSGDFTRNRILTPMDVMEFVLIQEKSTTHNNMDLYFDNHAPCTRQAIGRARKKLLPSAFQSVFYNFNHLNRKLLKPLGKYCFLSVDGMSTTCIPNKKEKEAWVRTAGKKLNAKFHSTIIMNDHTKTYVDAEVVKGPKASEIASFQTMIDRFEEIAPDVLCDEIPTFLADRLYFSFAILFNLQRHGYGYLIRAKDIHSKTSSLKEILFPAKEFDEWITFRLSFRDTKEIRRQAAEDGCIYKHLNVSASNFPYIPEGEDYVDLTVRVIRRLEKPDMDPNNPRNYITLVSNLPEEDFSGDELAEMYQVRWGHETSYKQVKYYCDLETFHSSQTQLIEQEIWAKMTLYNFSHMISNCSGLIKTDKYTYKPNFEISATAAVLFLLRRIDASEVLERLKKDRSPERPGRSYERHVKKPGYRFYAP